MTLWDGLGLETTQHPIRSDDDDDDVLRRVGVTQLQLEQDTAKSTTSTSSTSPQTLVDFNRSNSPLVEIVFEPDLHSIEESVALIKKVALILRRLGVSDATMEDGSLRVDVNLSMKLDGHSDGMAEDEAALRRAMNVRTELKNLASIRVIEDALESEIQRHTFLLATPSTLSHLTSSTRGYNAQTGQTYALRSKESSMDYRYLPDPDLGPVLVSEHDVEMWSRDMPESLDDIRTRLSAIPGTDNKGGGMGLSRYQVGVLVEQECVDLFDAVMHEPLSFPDLVSTTVPNVKTYVRDPKVTANFLLNTLAGFIAPHPLSSLSSTSRSNSDSDSDSDRHRSNSNSSNSSSMDSERPWQRLSPTQIASVIDAMALGRIYGHLSKPVLAQLCLAGASTQRRVSAWDLLQQDPSLGPSPSPCTRSLPESSPRDAQEVNTVGAAASVALEVAIRDTLSSQPKAIADLKKGKKQVMTFLMGQVMRRLQGRADPAQLKQQLETMLRKEHDIIN